MSRTGSRLRRRIVVAVVTAALVAAPAATASAAVPTSTGTVSGSDRAAAVQAVLDRVLGPGNAVVTVSDTVATSTSATTSVQWGTGAVSAAAAGITTVAGTTSRTVAQQHAVGSVTTSISTPPGGLVRQSVSVAVDRAHLGSVRVAALKRLVVSTAGIVRSRGDSVSLVVVPFAKRATVVPAASPTLLSTLLPYAGGLLWAGGGLLALVVLALAFGRRPKASAR